MAPRRGERRLESCIFCKIARRELPSTILYENEYVMAFEDISKMAPTHVLIIPKKHLQSVLELDPTDGNLLSALQEAVIAVAKKTGVYETGFRVITNVLEEAGQTVFHLHYHILGGRKLEVSLG
nr:histidine triad nucleotide-binding protein [Ferroacidibacillus organovorans]